MKRPSGSTFAFQAAKASISSFSRNSSLVMPMPCSPDTTPPSSLAKRMMCATASLAVRSIS